MGRQKSKQYAGYLPGLDGLRALAVLMVVAYHLWPKYIAGGYIGVDIFFVISGFLITSLLIREHIEKGKIDLQQFWVRRARRLLPALVVVIGVTSTFALVVGGDVLVGIGRQIIGALSFSSNWVEIVAGTDYFSLSSIHLFTNFWSLAVEEQFYALWPFVIIAILSLKHAKRFRVGTLLSITLSLGSAILMFLLLNPSDPTRVYYGTDSHAFGLMVGAGLAFWGNQRYAAAVAKGVKRPSAGFKHQSILQICGMISLTILIIACLSLSQNQVFTYSGGLYGVSILAGIVVLASVSVNGIIRKALEQRVLRYIGKRSYGIYLWHWPIYVLSHYWLGPASNPFVIAATTIALSFGCAIVSYRIIETPIRHIGFRQLIQRTYKKEVAVLDAASSSWKLRLHPLLLVGLLFVVTTITAVVTAPRITKAEQQVAIGQAAIATAQKVKAQTIIHKKQQPITGADMTLVGDSVSLASAPELQTVFPGIYIDAVVSRSMRRGGLETIEQLLAAKTMRSVLVVALGTNGYYGDGDIPRLMNEVGKDRRVIFMTAHAPVEWAEPNNEYLRSIQAQYPNMYIADWDAAIAVHPDYLGPDGIHPGPAGGAIYANCIEAVVAQINQHA